MKKALVLLLVLSFVGGVVFAQELTFSGKITSGVEIYADDAVDDAVVNVKDTIDEGVPVFFKLVGDFNADNFGAKFGIKNDNTEFYIVTDAHAWVALLDKMIIVRGGLIDTNLWGPGGNGMGGDTDWGNYKIDDKNITGASALQVEVKPMDGLSVGFSFWNRIGTPDAQAVTVGNFFTNSAFGFKYTADAFWLSAALALKNGNYKEGDDNPDYDDSKPISESNFPSYGEDSKTDMDVTFGFHFSGIENMGIHFAMYISELMGELALDPTIRMALDFDYTLSDAMSVQLQTLFGMKDGLKEMRFRPRFDYKLNDTMTATIRVPLLIGYLAAKDELGFAQFGLDLWLRNQIGKAYIQPTYMLKLNTEDFGDNVTHTIGFYIGTTF